MLSGLALLAIACALGIGVSGAAAELVVTEWDRSDADGLPQDISLGPDGAFWYTVYRSNTNGKIGRITAGGEITERLLPTTTSVPWAITAGPDGALWFTEVAGYAHQMIGRMTLAGQVTEFLLPTSVGLPWDIAAGPDGNLWFVGARGGSSGEIGRITPAGALTEFPLPSGTSAPEVYSASHIAAGPDGNLWFTLTTGVGRITPAGDILVIPTPTANDPAGIAAGPDGRVWFASDGYAPPAKGGTLVAISPVDLTMTDYALRPGMTGYDLTSGLDGESLWFSSLTTNQIGRMTTDGDLVDAFTIPTSGAYPSALAAGTSDSVWFVEEETDKLGRLADSSVIPPVTTAAFSPPSPNGSNGWYTTSIRLTVSATDSSGVRETRCVLDPATVPTTFAGLPPGCPYSGSGAEIHTGRHRLYFASVDADGNQEEVRTAEIRIDRRPPSANLKATGVAGDQGWFRSNVIVRTAGTDGGSGVAACTPDQKFAAETDGVAVAGGCSDNAGLVGKAPSLTVKIDRTAPDVGIALSPAAPDGLDGWYRRAPRLKVTGGDGLSGIAETRCVLDPVKAPATFDDLPAGCAYLTAAAATADGRHDVYAATRDVAGNRSGVAHVGWKRDHTGPSLGCAAAPKPLGPPDHRMVRVVVSIGGSDDLSGTNGFTLAGVTSSQPDSGLGPTDRPNDIQGWAPGTVDVVGQLRSEAYGGTRYYTLRYEARDRAGNRAFCTPKTNVPLG